MDFDALFADQLAKLKEEGNYRIFAEMERRCGSFPRADNYGPDGKREVTVWCSNDYLGMGQHPDVVSAMVTSVRSVLASNVRFRRNRSTSGRPSSRYR